MWDFGEILDFGRYMTFVNPNYITNNTVYWEDMGPGDIWFGLLATFSWTAECLVEMFVENLCAAITLSMWIATRLFINCFEEEIQMEWRDIHDRYRILCRLSELMNNSFGMWMGVYLLYSTSYLMATLDDILLLKQPDFPVTEILSQVVIISMVVAAASIPAQMNEMKMWLARNHDKIPEREYTSVTNELQWNMVGVRGGRNMFVITHSILWNVS